MLTAFIVLYLLLTLAAGYWASLRVRNTADYTLAGQSLPAIMVGVTLFATWFGPELIMGVPALFAKEGIQGIIIDQFGSMLCLLLVGMYFARQMYRLRIVTINDFFRLRFGGAIERVTSLMNVYTYFPWIAAQFLALGLLFHTLLGMPVAWGIVLGASVVLLYTYIGGMWAVSVTDLIQTVMIVLGLLYLTAVVLKEAGGIGSVLEKTPPGFFDFFPAPGWTNWIDYLFKWAIFGLGAIPAQDIYQRVLSARSETAGAHGAYLSALMLFVIGAIPLLAGLAISQLYPHLLLENEGQNMIPNMVRAYMGTPVQILFFGALISAILSTSSGALLAPATVIGENLIKPHFRSLSDRKLLLYTRLSTVLVAVISAIMAGFNTSIHGLVVDSVMLIMVAMLAPFVLGLYWKKASVKGAWAAICTGSLVWLAGMGIGTAIHPAMYGTLASGLAMVVASRVWPDESHADFLRRTAPAP